MVLNTFREKLSYEIKRLEEFLPYGIVALDKIQVHLYSVAILLRKIIEMLPGYEGKSINVSEYYKSGGGKHSDICLKDLMDRIIHYVKFSPGIIRSVKPSSLEYIQVISDWDREKYNIKHRELMLRDFINIAKEIAENDREVLKSLLNYAIENLERDMKCTDLNIISDEYFGVKTHESMVYVFDLVRKINNYKLPDGNITLFFEIEEDNKVIRIEEHEIEYSQIFKYFGQDWYISFGDSYLKTYQKTSDPNLKGNKVVSMYDMSDKNFERNNDECIIIAENLLDILKQIGSCKK